MRQNQGWLRVSLLTIVFFWKSCFALEKAFTPTMILLGLHCNGEDTSQIVYALQDREDELWLKKEAFKACRIPAQSEQKITYEDEIYYAIQQTGQIHYTYNPQLMTIDLIFPHSLLPAQSIDYNPIRVKKFRPKKSGLYLNYDVNFQRNPAEKLNNYSAITDWVYFNYFGVGHTDFLIKNGNQIIDSDSQHIVRLETTWTLDQPEKLATWRIGDSLSGTAIWSGAVKFGGIQYATNFAVQPGFITFPLPSFKGEAIVPTTVDFYLNNQLRTSQELSNGPFEIQGLPVVTGAGDLMV